MAKMPGPFRLEGPYLMIVPDASFLKKIMDIGYPTFERQATRLVGHADLFTPWCVDHAVVQYLTGNTLPPRKPLTCFNREMCSDDVECLTDLFGGFNTDNMILATQDHTQDFGSCARLPVLTYTTKNVLVYCVPSTAQRAFARQTKEQRQKAISDEAAAMKKKLKNLKRIKRLARV